MKDAEKPRDAKFETATMYGCAVVKWAGVPQGEAPVEQGRRRIGESNVDDIKLNISSYARGVGFEDAWAALDAGRFVRFVAANHAQYLMDYKIADDVIPSISMICTRGTFKDGLRNMLGDGKNESTNRMRIKRLEDNGHIANIGGGRGRRTPLILMRGDGWLPRFPWE